MPPLKKIDLKKTRKKGKEICESYISALEVKRIELEEDYIFSSSIISVSSDMKATNTIEKLYIEFAEEKEKYDDPASAFLQICSKISKIDKKYGDFLINKYFYSKTDDIIQYEILDVSRREFIFIKNKSYEYVAHMSNEIVYFNK